MMIILWAVLIPPPADISDTRYIYTSTSQNRQLLYNNSRITAGLLNFPAVPVY